MLNISMNLWPNEKKKDSFELLRKFPIQNSPNLPNLVVFYPIYRQLKIIKKIVFFPLVTIWTLWIFGVWFFPYNFIISCSNDKINTSFEICIQFAIQWWCYLPLKTLFKACYDVLNILFWFHQENFEFFLMTFNWP